MANPVYPSTLPELSLVDGFSATLPDNLVRTQMEVGEAKVRRRSTVAPMMVQMVSPKFGAADRDAFLAFFLTTLSGGALRFDMLDQVTGQVQEFRFVAPPLFRASGANLWHVACEFEVFI